MATDSADKRLVPDDSGMLRGCVAGLGLVVFVALCRDLSLLFLHIPLGANEGWNAYYADAAFGGRLYPDPPSMM